MNKNSYSGVFGVADFKSDVKKCKFKMANSIWRSGNFKIILILIKFDIGRFLELLISNMMLKNINSKWQI